APASRRPPMHPRFLSLRKWLFPVALAALVAFVPGRARAQQPVDVEGQPLAANITRLLKALDFLGNPLPADTTKALSAAAADKDAVRIQKALDPQVLAVVTLNPEARVKVARGPAKVTLQQSGYVPVIVKVVNDSTVMKSLRISSPHAGPIYSGGFAGDKLKDKVSKNNSIDVEMATKPQMTETLSGVKVEYAI